MRRFLSLWLTDWPIDRLRRARRGPGPGPGTSDGPAEPFALTERAEKGLRLAAVNRAAAGAGLAPGLTLAEARARLPGLASEEIDRAADAEALGRLALWAMRWSPVVAVDGLDALMLDVTGCAHLFGGESAMLADLSARLDRAGIAHRAGLGPTPGAAWALAHGAAGPLARLEADDPRRVAAGLSDLPVAGLRLGAETLTLLRRFGLGRIGQLAGLDRAALARRFQSAEAADRVLLRLDQATGRIAEPVRPVRPPAVHAARLPCPEPLADRAGIEAGLARLLADLCEELSAAGLGARALRLTAWRADGGVSEARVRAARPSRDPDHLARLFAERLDGIDPGHGVDLMALAAEATGAMADGARPLGAALGPAPAADAAAFAALADRIAARLGDSVVMLPAPVARHRPEAAEEWQPFDGATPDWTGADPGTLGPRPVRMLARPEPVEVIAEVPDGPPVRFTWRRVARAVTRAEGPERIAPDWWLAEPGPREAAPGARDYFRVEDDDGRRYWLYREGLYGDGRGVAPRWYLAGLFA